MKLKRRAEVFMDLNMHNTSQKKEIYYESFLKRMFTDDIDIQALSGGRLNKVFRISNRNVEKVVKISSGPYRIMELHREAEIIKYLNEIGLNQLLPEFHGFNEKEDLAYLIESYVSGTSVRHLLETKLNADERSNVWFKLGHLLSQLHEVNISSDSNIIWLEGQLELASMNLVHHLVDLDDFGNEDPKEVFKWLVENKPMRTEMSVLHGDFRTKNIIVDDSTCFKAIDWGFVDIGDPIYDLAIIDYYFKDNQDRQAFYRGYKHIKYDQDLIDYYEKLSRYINI